MSRWERQKMKNRAQDHNTPTTRLSENTCLYDLLHGRRSLLDQCEDVWTVQYCNYLLYRTNGSTMHSGAGHGVSEC